MQRDLVVILYGSIYNQYKIANIIKLCVGYNSVTLNKINIHNTSCVLTCESLFLACMTDNCSYELKLVAQCYVTLKCCVGQHISFACDIGKHNGIY